MLGLQQSSRRGSIVPLGRYRHLVQNLVGAIQEHRSSSGHVARASSGRGLTHPIASSREVGVTTLAVWAMDPVGRVAESADDQCPDDNDGQDSEGEYEPSTTDLNGPGFNGDLCGWIPQAASV